MSRDQQLRPRPGRKARRTLLVARRRAPLLLAVGCTLLGLSGFVSSLAYVGKDRGYQLPDDTLVVRAVEPRPATIAIEDIPEVVEPGRAATAEATASETEDAGAQPAVVVAAAAVTGVARAVESLPTLTPVPSATPLPSPTPEGTPGGDTDGSGRAPAPDPTATPTVTTPTPTPAPPPAPGGGSRRSSSQQPSTENTAPETVIPAAASPAGQGEEAKDSGLKLEDRETPAGSTPAGKPKQEHE